MKTAFDIRNNSLDFLRLFFAVLVILSHCFPLGVGREDIEPMMRLTGGQTTLGTMAVESFFIISGFLIAHSYLKSRSMAAYFRKRAARIYPGFVICMLICGLIVAPLAGAISPFQHLAGRFVNFAIATAVLREFSYQHAFSLNPNGAINGSVWTISYEFACYIVVALLGVGGLLRRKQAILILFCVSLMALSGADFLVTLCRSGALQLAPILDHPYFWDKVLLRGPLIPAYLAGVAFYAYRERIPQGPVWAEISLCVLALACVAPGTWHLAFPVAGTYLLFWVAFHPRVQVNFSRFGDFSYGTYLYAFPIQQLVVQVAGGTLGPYVLFAVAAPLSILAGFASWHGVERWFLSRGPGINPGSTASAVGVQVR